MAENILSADKHQLVEGLVVESLFDQFVENIPTALPEILPLDIETVVTDRGHEPDRWIAVVWARTRTPGLGRYLQALEKRFAVFLVERIEGHGFAGSRVREGKREKEPVPLDDLLSPLATALRTEFSVDHSVRDASRQRKAIWGFLMDQYGDRLAEHVLLPRLLINCGVQPWFRAVWNLDRIFVAEDGPWLFEVKHKFPYGSPLKFGINVGELNVLGMLASCGVRVLHTLMIKPRWSKEVGSMYMLNDLRARDRTAIIGRVLDEAAIAKIAGRVSGKSGADTTITGTSGGSLNYKPMLATEFSMFGVFSDKPSAVATRLAEEMAGKRSPSVTEDALRALRLVD
ncbi:MAG: hypothetical protein HY770_04410 [Chitinivibrionia bacterium]|nr:hypothetical protein [Chitinivibrionia bacterium]